MKNVQGFVCVCCWRHSAFAPWAVSWATLLRWEEENVAVVTPPEDPPHHCVLCCLLGHRDHGNTTARRRHSTPANKAQVKVWKAGAQCRADIEAKLGVRRGKAQQSPTPGISMEWGSSSSMDVGDSTTILLWKAAEQAMVVVEGGRKGNFQLQAQGREGCQLWEQAWQDVTGEGTNKITTYQKGQRAWECSVDQMGVGLHTQRSEQLGMNLGE